MVYLTVTTPYFYYKMIRRKLLLKWYCDIIRVRNHIFHRLEILVFSRWFMLCMFSTLFGIRCVHYGTHSTLKPTSIWSAVPFLKLKAVKHDGVFIFSGCLK
ncbi:hypothetical protein ACH3XW_37980 [Acanthocheilonema viteae]